MARLTIRLVQSCADDSFVLQVAFHSDEDSTPSEHERDHRRLVAALLPGIDLDAPPARVQIERVRPLREPCSSCGGGPDDYQVIDLG
jgi:hypothetical protein